jgi:hypothetical protein
MKIRKALLGGALTAAALLGGAAGASLINGTAGAQTSSTTAPAPSNSSSDSTTGATYPAHGTAEHEGLEKAVTGDAATKAQQAAVAYVGGGTAGDVTTDVTGNGYEVTVTKADGSQVEIHLDSSFNAIQGGHGGPGRGPGTNDGDADDAPSTNSSPTTGG